MKIKDRIVELRRVPARDLLPNERNWRRHSAAQAEALRGVLAEIGFAGAALAYQTPEGLKLIDGHLRDQIASEVSADIPVLVTDLSEAEANEVLATFDPLGAMATADQQALDTLLREISSGSAAVQQLLDQMAQQAGLVPPTDPIAEWQGMPEFVSNDPCYRKVVVNFDTAEDVAAFFQLIGQEDSGKTKSIWYPAKARHDLESVRYAEDDAAADDEGAVSRDDAA